MRKRYERKIPQYETKKQEKRRRLLALFNKILIRKDPTPR